MIDRIKDFYNYYFDRDYYIIRKSLQAEKIITLFELLKIICIPYPKHINSTVIRLFCLTSKYKDCKDSKEYIETNNMKNAIWRIIRWKNQ